MLVGNFFKLKNGAEIEVPVYGPVEQCAAVETRAQKVKPVRGDLPLGPQGARLQKTRAELVEGQKSDKTLDRVRALARSNRPWKVQGQGKVRFIYKGDILYREFKGADNIDHRQVCVPLFFRREVLEMGHDAPMLGHLGRKRTQHRVWTEFYWPGMCSDVRRYVASCDACQKTVPKISVQKVALGKKPLSEVPYQQVAPDLIGLVQPASVGCSVNQVRITDVTDLEEIQEYHEGTGYRCPIPLMPLVAEEGSSEVVVQPQLPMGQHLTKGKELAKIAWTPEREIAFNHQGDALADRPVLRLPVLTRSFVLRTDASDRGLGAVLHQDTPEGLQTYSFTVVSIPGSDYVDADFLSREACG